jgi:NTE family protein
MAQENAKKRVAIACQGGGAHAAFAAGVLKTILNRVQNGQEYEIVALSGTSGGAICAFLAWYALLKDNNEQEAVELLETFWKEDNAARWPGEAWIANNLVKTVTEPLEKTVGIPAPNPYNIPEYFSSLPPLRSPDYWQHQLKTMLEKKVSTEMIEERVASSGKEQVTSSDVGPMLYIGAANPRTGEFQVFRSHKPSGNYELESEDEREQSFVFNRSPNDGISVEAVLASAAIPSLFKAVHTGKAVYWHSSQRRNVRPYIDEAVYWDGLYSSNPPIHQLADSNPDEIWVIQINPEEIDEEPTRTGEIEDRRNELAGNLSLNKELSFVRETNQLIRTHKIPKKTIKVRRIELTRPLDYSSKLNRDAAFTKELMDKDAKEEATPFLEALAALSTFEEAWEKAQRDRQQADIDIEDVARGVMNLFAEEAKIKLVPPEGSPASEQCYESDEDIRRWVQSCLERNFNLEQARYYRVDEEKISWWMLVTADRFHLPIKGRIEVAIKEGKIESLAFYPLDMKLVEMLEVV